MASPRQQNSQGFRHERCHFLLMGVFAALEVTASLEFQPNPDSPMNLLGNIAKHSNIKTEQLLIVDIRGFLSKFTFSAGAFLLSAEIELHKFEKPMSKNQTDLARLPRNSAVPWFLSALAASQFIAIFSKAKSLMKLELHVHLCQNIRHRCIVRTEIICDSSTSIAWSPHPSMVAQDECYHVLQEKCRHCMVGLEAQWSKKQAECLRPTSVSSKLEKITFLPVNGGNMAMISMPASACTSD